MPRGCLQFVIIVFPDHIFPVCGMISHTQALLIYVLNVHVSCISLIVSPSCSLQYQKRTHTFYRTVSKMQYTRDEDSFYTNKDTTKTNCVKLRSAFCIEMLIYSVISGIVNTLVCYSRIGSLANINFQILW